MIVMQDLGRKNSRQIRCNRELGISIDKCDSLNCLYHAGLCHADWSVRARKKLDDVVSVPECAKVFFATIKQKKSYPVFYPWVFCDSLERWLYCVFLHRDVRKTTDNCHVYQA